MGYLVRLELDSGEEYPLADRINPVELADFLGPGIWLSGRQDFYDVLSDVQENAGIDVSPLRRLDDLLLRPAPGNRETRQRDGYVLGPESWQGPLELALCLQSILSCLESHPPFIPFDFSGTLFERAIELLRDLVGECLWAADLKSNVRFAFFESAPPAE